MAIKLTVNNTAYEVDVPAGDASPVGHPRRSTTGTKYGCGIAQCGACTVHIDGAAVRSCITSVGDVAGAVTTIEGLSANGDHPIQAAWSKHNVPQCGYCQSGQMMNAAAFIKENPHPTDADIDSAMSGNICRCGTYGRIRAAIKEAAENI
jgi:isoquinoline 1-oxidoreductase alpha subunit